MQLEMENRNNLLAFCCAAELTWVMKRLMRIISACLSVFEIPSCYQVSQWMWSVRKLRLTLLLATLSHKYTNFLLFYWNLLFCLKLETTYKPWTYAFWWEDLIPTNRKAFSIHLCHVFSKSGKTNKKKHRLRNDKITS